MLLTKCDNDMQNINIINFIIFITIIIIIIVIIIININDKCQFEKVTFRPFSYI